MNNLEKQLNNLPRKKLRLNADYLLRFKLYKAMWQKKAAIYIQYFSFKKHLSPLAITIVLISLIIGVPGYAYANENITASHYLYGVKKAVEKIELTLTFSKEKKQEKQEKFIIKRLNEAEILSKNTGVEEQNSALVKTIKEAMELRKKIVEKEIKPQGFTENKEIKQIKTLKKIANTIGIKAEEKVLNVVVEALETVKKTKPINEKKKNIKQNINMAQNEIEKLNNDFKNDVYQEEDVKILNKHFEIKIKKAKDAVKKNDINAANDIIESTKALTNNAKYFLKEKINKKNKKKFD